MKNTKPDETFLLNMVKLVRDHPPANAAFMIHQIFDGIYNDTPKEVDCSEGCSWCCYSRVGVTELEMKAVESHIRHRFTHLQVQRVVKAAKALKKKYQKLTQEERVYSRDACPLLMDNRCSVYNSRPLMCRSALSMDAKACERAHTNVEAPVPMMIASKNFATEMIAAIQIGENKKEYELNIVDGILKHFK